MGTFHEHFCGFVTIYHSVLTVRNIPDIHRRENKYNILIKFIYFNRVVTRWQWLFYMYTEHEIGYY